MKPLFAAELFYTMQNAEPLYAELRNLRNPCGTLNALLVGITHYKHCRENFKHNQTCN
jgi:hypothetical protein